MGKSKDIKLPKYLKLNKGNMWFDNDPDDKNASGVRLIDTDINFVGRGYISNSEMQKYNETGITPHKQIGVDLNKNKEATHNAYGYIINNKDQSFFCTTDIPADKLGNILTAYNNKILVAYSPTAKPIESEKLPTPKKNFTYHDGDLVFSGTNKNMYNKLNKLSLKDMLEFIKNCNVRNDIQDLLQYETKGFNKVARARLEIMDALRIKLNSFGSGISSIRMNDIDDVKTEK